MMAFQETASKRQYWGHLQLLDAMVYNAAGETKTRPQQ
jgi:hypothetical protein